MKREHGIKKGRMGALMNAIPTRALLVALTLSLAILLVWAATGSRSYTTLTTLEVVEAAPAADDPLADTGFYDTAPAQTVKETSGFRLGLLPTPRGLFDPHALSVLTLMMFAWAPFGALLGRRLWQARSQIRPGFATTSSTRS